MKKMIVLNRTISLLLVLTIFSLTPLVFAQTRIVPPKNPYKPNQDVELGRQAANEVNQKMPIMRDRQVQTYVERIGKRLVNSLPEEYQFSEFEYSFQVVDAKDINAFALPGGFTYVNTGLIEVAKNEGELAGVMAHEISHVALRHGTAQAAKAQKYSIGAAAGTILGGIIGGTLGGIVAQGSQLGVGAYFLRFSRDYERQADLLGAQMMARAGYDPRDLANMFQTIEKASGGRGGPEWLSSHPNPGNRYKTINQEADSLKIERPVRNTNDFYDVQARVKQLSGRTARPETAAGNRSDRSDRNDSSGTSGGRRGRIGRRVELPSTSYRSYTPGRLFQIDIPDNWRELSNNSEITYAPEGAYGEAGGKFIFTHGVMVGVSKANSNNLRDALDGFINAVSQSNPNLRQQGAYKKGNLSGRDALGALFTNVSDVTGKTESVGIYTAFINRGDLFYVITVTPQLESRQYQRTFQDILRSVEFGR
ncbi:MAG: M48 family metalloprotease [Blastocatellia bacterium]|nr:M48 family metalloprotease [Blastocatellia bacterium]